jgi:hypothetical protein
MATDPKSIKDVMEDFDRAHNIPIDITDSVTHDQFLEGVKKGNVGIKVLIGEPSALVSGVRKMIFNVLVLLYLLAPAVVVPLWAYHEHNWWLLFGIGVSWISTFWTASSRSVIYGNKTAGGLLFLVCIVSWLALGIHNYVTFFSLCALWGCVVFQIAETCQNDYALQCLMENPELFNRATATKRIMVIRRREPHELGAPQR